MSAPTIAPSSRFADIPGDARFPLIIDGEERASETGATFRCLDPFDEEEWGYVAQGGAVDVDLAVGSSRKAFATWRATPQSVRSRIVSRWGDLMVEHADELGRLQVHENGKTLVEMRSAVVASASAARHFAHLASTHHGVTVDPGVPHHQAWTLREPIGVVAAITPWNNPIGLLCWKLFPAVAVGNTVVIKPSEVTPASTVRLVQLGLEAGLPPGVVNVVTGAGETGRALAEHPDVDKIAFTGSTATGRAIAVAAAARFADVTLELGGKGPNIVFSDADIDRAVEGLRTGVTAGNGQACNAGSRLLIHADIRDEVVERLGRSLAEMRIGDPLDPNTELGPLASRAQHAKILSYFDIAREEGHRLVTGGSRVDGVERGLFVRPTLYDDVDNRSRLAQEEVFGPVGAAMTFRTDEEALALANDIPYGLTAGFWTNDLERAHRLQSQIRSGVVWINTWRVFTPNLPFGGVKASGIGHENGLDALDNYTETKSVYLGLRK